MDSGDYCLPVGVNPCVGSIGFYLIERSVGHAKSRTFRKSVFSPHKTGCTIDTLTIPFILSPLCHSLSIMPTSLIIMEEIS